MINLTPIIDEVLEEWFYSYPEDACNGIDCDLCPVNSTNRKTAQEEEGLSDDEACTKYSCDSIGHILLKEMLRRGTITQQQADDKEEEE